MHPKQINIFKGRGLRMKHPLLPEQTVVVIAESVGDLEMIFPLLKTEEDSKFDPKLCTEVVLIGPDILPGT